MDALECFTSRNQIFFIDNTIFFILIVYCTHINDKPRYACNFKSHTHSVLSGHLHNTVYGNHSYMVLINKLTSKSYIFFSMVIIMINRKVYLKCFIVSKPTNKSHLLIYNTVQYLHACVHICYGHVVL